MPNFPPRLPCPPDQLDHFLSQPSREVIDFISRQKGTVLVLGAGGKMGLHLCRMIKAASVAARTTLEVIAVSRFTSLRDQSAFSEAGVRTIPCDLTDAAQLAALPEAETVYFLAGLKFGTNNAPELLHQMNVQVPHAVAQRYQRSRLVAFSTGCVYPFVPVTSRGATEATPPAPVGAYAESCLGRENEFAASSVSHGTPAILIRLNYAVEFRYGVLVDIATKVRDETPIDVTMGHVNVIWQRDAIDQIIRALALATSPAIPLNIAGREVVSVRQLAEDFGVIFGKAPRFTGVEASTAWLNNAEKSHALLGMPATSLATMQAWVAAWLSSAGTTWGKPTGFEKRDGNF